MKRLAKILRMRCHKCGYRRNEAYEIDDTRTCDSEKDYQSRTLKEFSSRLRKRRKFSFVICRKSYCMKCRSLMNTPKGLRFLFFDYYV